jgi:hypothetical protein
MPELLILLPLASFPSLSFETLYLPLLRQGYEEPSNNPTYTHGHHDHSSTLIHSKADMARHAGGVLKRSAARPEARVIGFDVVQVYLEGDRSPLDEGPHEGIFCLADG